jgi:hypothetical protein
MMARFTQFGIYEYSGSSSDGTWIIEGGTLQDPQPTFSGDPMFSGDWSSVGNIISFNIDVSFGNILTFGTGQFYLKLPFPSHDNRLLSDGCLHDILNNNDQYSIVGHVNAGSDILELFSITSNGRQNPFTKQVPVHLNNEDNFHISGVYEKNH